MLLLCNAKSLSLESQFLLCSRRILFVHTYIYILLCVTHFQVVFINIVEMTAYVTSYTVLPSILFKAWKCQFFYTVIIALA